LLDSGAKLDHIYLERNTWPLMYAAETNNYCIAKLLIESGADVHFSRNGKSLSKWMTQRDESLVSRSRESEVPCFLEVRQILIDKGIDAKPSPERQRLLDKHHR
jgi:hypothetical protein